MGDPTPRRAVVIACWLLLVAASAARAEDEANGPFQAGLVAVNEQRWEEAIGLFRESLKVRQHSLTLYMLAVCSAERMKAQDTLDYAVRALETRPPPLEDKYARHARALLMWAAEVLLLPLRVRAKYAMDTHDDQPSHDLLTSRASDEEDELERQKEEVREKVGPYLELNQLELELRLLEAADPCSALGASAPPSQVNRCLESIFEEEGFLPEPPEPELPAMGSTLPTIHPPPSPP